jgi:hypothetical protein
MNAQLPRVRRKTIAETIDDGTVNMTHAEVLLSGGIQANGWLDNIRAAYEQCPNFENILIALGGKETLEAEPGAKSFLKKKKSTAICTGGWPNLASSNGEVRCTQGASTTGNSGIP